MTFLELISSFNTLVQAHSDKGMLSYNERIEIIHSIITQSRNLQRHLGESIVQMSSKNTDELKELYAQTEDFAFRTEEYLRSMTR